MQPLLLSIFLLLQPVPQDTAKIQTSVESATVFLNGAEVQRSASVTLQPGTNLIAFTGLSTSLREETIRLGADQALTLESVSKTIRTKKSDASDEDINRLKMRKKAVEDSINQAQARLKVLDQKLTVLMSNQDISGENSKISARELEQAINYFDEEFEAIETNRIDLNARQQKLSEQLKNIKDQLNRLQSRQRQAAGIIEIAVQSDSRRQATLALSYFVPDSRWRSSYDVRVEDVDTPLDLSYKANIAQNTGVDWNDVQLTISSAKPRSDARLPSVNPVFIQLYEPRRNAQSIAQKARPRFNVQNLRAVGEAGISQVSGTVLDAQSGKPVVGANIFVPQIGHGAATDENGQYRIQLEPNAKSIRITFVGYETQNIPITSSKVNVRLQAAQLGLDDVVVTGAGSNPVETQLRQGQTAFSFEIKNPYTIKSGESAITVPVKAHSLPAQYEYFSVPKEQEKAFLTAKLVDWESLNLLPGEISLFLDNSYVGKTNFNLNTAEDTLSFSLGQDDGIIIEREQIESFREKNFFGNKVTETKGWDITLRNTKSKQVSVTVVDQVPVSRNEDVKVELTERSGASFEKSNGWLEWTIVLRPGSSQSLRFVYETTYPSDKEIIETGNL